MKWMKHLLTLCLVCALAGSASAYATEGTEFVWELLKAESPGNVAFDKTVVLSDGLQFSIPADWDTPAETDDKEVFRFAFEGTDAEGRSVIFFGLESGSEAFDVTFSSYTEMKNTLVEAETSHILSSLNGMDMVFMGDDELMAGICLTQDGDFFAFGFISEEYALGEIRQSDKLKADMAAILHSAKAIDADRLMSFDASIWEPSKRRGETRAAEAHTPAEREESAQVRFFKRVTGGNGLMPDSSPVYLDETLVVSVPDDWREMKEENAICAFVGTDEDGNWASVVIDAVQANGLTAEELEADAKGQIACCAISANGIRYFTVLTSSASLVTTWLADGGTVYRITARLQSEAGMQSEKLIGDLHRIMCNLRPVYEGELGQKRTIAMLADRDHSDETPASFLDPEFERMIRAAMDRGEEAPIYPSELAAIRNMSIRCGNMRFSPEIQMYAAYEQPGVLDLADLRQFPNLVYLDITDMKCTGFPILSELPELRRLTLIRTGLLDCSFLYGMTLKELNLAGNDLADFAPIAAVSGLKELNVTDTGLQSLEFVRSLNLTLLVAANNPVSDLDPVSSLSGLSCLFIQNTEVTSLEALRNLTELEELNIRDLKGEISLEPLYEHKKLKRVLCSYFTLSEEDRARFKDVLW